MNDIQPTKRCKNTIDMFNPAKYVVYLKGSYWPGTPRMKDDYGERLEYGDGWNMESAIIDAIELSNYVDNESISKVFIRVEQPFHNKIYDDIPL